MIELKDASASLTLKNVVIDGAEYSVAATHAAETDSIIKAASGGTIELKSGAILENNKAAQFGSGILANNGVKITMENGASFVTTQIVTMNWAAVFCLAMAVPLP